LEPDGGPGWADDSHPAEGTDQAEEHKPADSTADADDTAPAEPDWTEPVTGEATHAPGDADTGRPAAAATGGSGGSSPRDAAAGEYQPDSAPDVENAEVSADAGGDDDMPVFHRMWSSPTPPAG
jgi:hypothetical protein